MAVKEVLLRAAELVEQGWTQNAFARNEKGEIVSSHSEDAVCWCAAGAVNKAATETNFMYDEPLWDVVETVVSEVTNGLTHSEVSYNDHHARNGEEVADVLRKAAERV